MFGYTLMNHSSSMRTTSTFSVRTPMFSSLSLSANSFPSRRSSASLNHLKAFF